MNRMLSETISLLRSNYLNYWSLLLLPALFNVRIDLSGSATTTHLLLRFLGFGIALIPFARVISSLVDQLSEHLGDRYSGVVSVGLGNLVELVVSITALTKGLYGLVVISVAGAVITNCLLMLGISTFVVSRHAQHVAIQLTSTDLQARQLMLSLLFLAVPTVVGLSGGITPIEGDNQINSFALYSLVVAVMILLYYLLSYVLQLGTHRTLFSGNRPAKDTHAASFKYGSQAQKPGLAAILIAMSIVSVAVVLISDPLVQTLQDLVRRTTLSELFVGLILLPLFGSVAEGVIAIGAAARGRIDLVLTSTLESSVQLMMLVLPVLVLVGWPLGRYLHLTVPLTALGFTGISVLAVHWITENGQLDWYEGVQLITLYCLIFLGTLLL